jgi:hypothetical protein
MRRVVRTTNQFNTLMSQLEQIASRFWTDLVCVEDYFEPIGGWMCKEKSSGQPGEFVVALNPDLHPGGDFVSRCMCRRAEVIKEVLGDFHRIANKALSSAKMAVPKAWAELSRRFDELTALVRRLRQTCMEGDRQILRDNCILLTQVYAALSSDADVSWLGVPESIARRGIALMSHRLRSRHSELLERLVASLARLKKLYADADENQSAVDEAIASGALVLLGSRRAFWEGAELKVDWPSRPKMWKFLQTLAKKGQGRGFVVQQDVNSDAMGGSTLATLYYRLKKKVPASLWKHIRCHDDPKGYQLNLEPRQVFLF